MGVGLVLQYAVWQCFPSWMVLVLCLNEMTLVMFSSPNKPTYSSLAQWKSFISSNCNLQRHLNGLFLRRCLFFRWAFVRFIISTSIVSIRLPWSSFDIWKHKFFTCRTKLAQKTFSTQSDKFQSIAATGQIHFPLPTDFMKLPVC